MSINPRMKCKNLSQVEDINCRRLSSQFWINFLELIPDFFDFSDNLSRPQLLGSVHENKTATLGGSVTFYCAVQSLGPTEIQWLKQLHDHQQPKNPNKTVVVFDYVFEVSRLRVINISKSEPIIFYW